MNNKFIIVTPLYNVEKWVKYCITSVMKQKYDNYEHYVIDDISTDQTNSIIKKCCDKSDKLNLVTNTEKKYALKNIHDTLESLDLDDNDIIVILDGDDWLASDQVLQKLNNIYKQQDCWMTYGSYVEYPSNQRGKFSKKIPNQIIDNSLYRERAWMSSHLRTFRYKLWKKINKQDFINPKTNKFIKAAWDLGFVFPMLEMAGKKAFYVEDILYIYNRDNPLNEDKVDHSKQLNEESYVRSKKKYQLLKEL